MSKHHRNLSIPILAWSLLILLMLGIFLLSDQPTALTNRISMGLTEKLMAIGEAFVDSNLGISAKEFNWHLRELAHFVLFFVLGVLAFIALRFLPMEERKATRIAIGLCILYAVLDEGHQIFVVGRSAGLRDVIIDVAGALTGIGLARFLSGIKRKKGRNRSPVDRK